MYTSDDIIKMIDLIEPPYESEVIEFKEAKSNFSFREIGQYFSAISNEALLREKHAGWLIFGIDNDKQACGTNYRLGNPNSLQSLKREVASYTNGRLTFREIHDFVYKEKRIVAFDFHPPPLDFQQPLTTRLMPEKATLSFRSQLINTRRFAK